jgi:hypothetical protein
MPSLVSDVPESGRHDFMRPVHRMMKCHAGGLRYQLARDGAALRRDAAQ